MRMSSQTLTKRLIPGLILGFLVLIGLALVGDLSKVSTSILTFRWEYFLIAIGFTLLNYLLRFIKWHYYLSQIGVRDISWAQSLRMFVAGFPLAVTPGKVGEALKGVWLNRKCGVPVGRGVSVVLAERISDGLAVLILSTLGVVAYPQYWPAFAIILSLLLSVVILSQIRPAAYFLLGVGEKLPLVNRMAHGLREFYEGSFALFRPGVMLVAVLLGTISWLGEGVGLSVGVFVGVCDGMRVMVTVGVKVIVGVLDGTGVTEGVNVADGVNVGDGPIVLVGEGVLVGVSVGAAVGASPTTVK